MPTRLAHSVLPLLIAGALLFGCREENRTQYTVRGLYRGAAFGGEAFVVDHEAIPGYMEAMRMTLRVKNPALLSGLTAGDKIEFDLVVEPTETYVEKITVLPEDTPLQLAPETGLEAPSGDMVSGEAPGRSRIEPVPQGGRT